MRMVGGGADAQLARGFLLQGRGDEGRRRVAPHLAAVDRGDGEGAALDLALGLLGALLVVEVELVELAAVEMGEARLEGVCFLAVPNSTSTVQYSRLLKTSISASRSQIRRSATDCTRPAERLPGSLRHSTGERVKPTR